MFRKIPISLLLLLIMSGASYAAGDEAPQELRNKVNAAKDAGRAPKR